MCSHQCNSNSFRNPKTHKTFADKTRSEIHQSTHVQLRLRIDARQFLAQICFHISWNGFRIANRIVDGLQISRLKSIVEDLLEPLMIWLAKKIIDCSRGTNCPQEEAKNCYKCWNDKNWWMSRTRVTRKRSHWMRKKLFDVVFNFEINNFHSMKKHRLKKILIFWSLLDNSFNLSTLFNYRTLSHSPKCFIWLILSSRTLLIWDFYDNFSAVVQWWCVLYFQSLGWSLRWNWMDDKL